MAIMEYRKGLKNRELARVTPQNFRPERETVAERPGAIEDENYEAKPTQVKQLPKTGRLWGMTPAKTDFSATNGIPLHFFGGSGFGLDGNQILHDASNNRSYRENSEALRFVDAVLKEALPLESDAEILRFASESATIDGLFLELGTYKGRTTNFLAALNPRKTLYTFDSYLGFPASWDRGDLLIPPHVSTWPEGKPLPTFLLNVELKIGWFADTLPKFISLHDEPIAFLHVDCDIYESTAQALEILSPLIVHGTVLLFDEFYNYPTYLDHEHKAFEEFLKTHAFEAEYLAFNVNHEQVAVRVLKKSAIALPEMESENAKR